MFYFFVGPIGSQNLNSLKLWEDTVVRVVNTVEVQSQTDSILTKI